MKLVSTLAIALMASGACSSGLEPQKLDKLPCFFKWAHSSKRDQVRDLWTPRANHLPVPELPTSSDYYQVCDLLRLNPQSGVAHMIFDEVFEQDSDGHITGVADYGHIDQGTRALMENHQGHVAHWFHNTLPEDFATKYRLLQPWVAEVKRLYPRPRSCTWLTDILSTDCNGVNGRPFYINKLVSDAIKYNFADNEADRDLLLSQVDPEADGTPTRTLRWVSTVWNFNTEFDEAHLAALKPGLLAYLADLKALSRQS